MTPLTQNPVLVILVDETGDVVGTATNVAPDLKIEVVRSQKLFDEASKNKPFVTGNTPE